MWRGAARCGQDCGHAVAARRPAWIAKAESPLDPQDVGVGTFAGQPGCKRRAHERPTCGSSAPAQNVWSPSGPQRLISVCSPDLNQQLDVLEVMMRFCCLMSTDDLARWEPRGSPQGGRRDPTPCPHRPTPPALGAGHPGDLPARRGHVLVGWRCVGRCSAAGRTPTRVLAVEMVGELLKRWLTMVDVGWCWVTWFVPDLCRDRPEPDTISTPAARRATSADDDHT